MQTFWRDIRYGLRLLRRSPGFTLVAVLALALGIGANTAIFSVVNSVLLAPLPYRDPGRLVIVWENSLGQGWNRIGLSGPNLVDFKAQSQTFDGMTAVEAGTGTVTGFGEPQQVPGLRVSNNFLSLLGAKVALGRDFLSGEGWSNRVVVLSHTAWQRYFGLDPNVIGRRVMADGLPYTVIGILPRDFWSPVPAEVIVPWNDQDLRREQRMNHRFGVFARLKPGVTLQQATAELTAIERRIAEHFPALKGWGVTVSPMQESLVEYIRPALLILLGAVGLVLLIACTNLANLLLARAATRERETAIRTALGADRRRLVRQFLTESLALGLIGGALGLLLALWGVDLLETAVPHTIRLPDVAAEIVRPHIGVDGRVLAFTLLMSLATGISFGLAPAFAASQAGVNETLKEGGRSISLGNRKLRYLLVVSEVALALVLLICSGLTMKSFWRIQQVKPGFRADHVLSMEMELPTDSKYRQGREQADFFRKLLEQVERLPGLRSAGLTCVLPLDSTEDDKTDFLIEGRPPLPSGQRLPADYRAVSDRYFATLGIPLRKGRSFSDGDKWDAPPVAIVNETLARRFFSAGNTVLDPIGQRLSVGRSVREIVGIVGDVKESGLDKQPAATIYVPYLQSPEPRMTLVARTASDPASMIHAVKQAVYAVDKDQPVYKIRTMDQVLSDSQASPRFTLILLGIFAAAALGLASIGIYGVISYSVAQRTHEIGIRIALGARTGHVLRLVVGQGMLLAALGLALGLAAALALTRLLAALLYGVSARDPVVFAGTSIILGAVALLASYIPARRAARLDPIVSLRYE